MERYRTSVAVENTDAVGYIRVLFTLNKCFTLQSKTPNFELLFEKPFVHLVMLYLYFIQTRS